MLFDYQNSRAGTCPVNYLGLYLLQANRWLSGFRLSLTYTLLHYEAVRTAISASLDPILGFLHKPSYDRESLACDLTELLRASANQWVWQVFHDRWLRADHFTHDKGACLLNKTGRSHYYPAFQTRMAQKASSLYPFSGPPSGQAWSRAMKKVLHIQGRALEHASLDGKALKITLSGQSSFTMRSF